MKHICRLCTQTTFTEHFELDGNVCASTNLKVKDILQNCFPELDLDLVQQAVICKNCLFSLYYMYNFKIETLRNEETFHNKQSIRLKNLDFIKGDVLQNDSYCKSEGIEIEFDNIEELNTELVYDNEIEEDNIIDIIEESSTVNKNEIKYNEFSHIIKYPKLLSIDKTEVMVPMEDDSTKKEECNFNKLIICTTSNKKEIDKIKPYSCTECNYSCGGKTALVMHNRIHSGEKPFHCAKCTYKAKRKSHLEDHLKTHTGERPFVCSYCGKCFTTKQILKKHIRTHTGEKPYQCLKCNFKASHRKSIAVHIIKEHAGTEKVPNSEPCMCYVCGKKLSGYATLRIHLKSHAGIKKHLCELCGKYFLERGTLKNHLRTHTGEKPFKCSQCNYSATRKAHLQHHMQTHVPSRELTECIICNKQYTTKVLLKRHLNEEHPESK